MESPTSTMIPIQTVFSIKDFSSTFSCSLEKRIISGIPYLASNKTVQANCVSVNQLSK